MTPTLPFVILPHPDSSREPKRVVVRFKEFPGQSRLIHWRATSGTPSWQQMGCHVRNCPECLQAHRPQMRVTCRVVEALPEGDTDKTLDMPHTLFGNLYHRYEKMTTERFLRTWFSIYRSGHYLSHDYIVEVVV